VKGLKEKDRSREHPMERTEVPARRAKDGLRGNVALTAEEIEFIPEGSSDEEGECE